MRVVEPDQLHEAMLEYEAVADGRIDGDERVPFTREEMDAMAADPCAFGYHRFTPTAEEVAAMGDDDYYEGLCCLNGCGYCIG